MEIRLWIRLKVNKILPSIVKLMRKNGQKKVKAYKEFGRWFISDFNGYSKESNELVDGIPQLIEHFVGKNTDKVVVYYDDKPFDGSKTIRLVSTDEFGTWYEYIDDRGVPHMGWLCPVFFWYFPDPPNELYILITAENKATIIK